MIDEDSERLLVLKISLCFAPSFSSSRSFSSSSTLQTPTLSYILVQPSAGLLFPAVEYLRIYLLENLATDQHKLLRTFKNSNVVVLDCKHIDKIDYTAAHVRAIFYFKQNISNLAWILPLRAFFPSYLNQ